MEKTDPLTYKGWNELLLNSPGCSIFHTENWAAVLAKTYRYHPHYFFEKNSSKFEFLLPVMEVQSWITGPRGVCLPFSDLCPPIVGGNIRFPDNFSQVIDMTKDYHWNHLEIRGGAAMRELTTPSLSYCLHTLTLQRNPEDVFRSFRSNYRSKVKKAVESDLKVDILYSREAINSYYKLHCLKRQRHGLPPQPLLFFKNIYDHIISQKLGFIALAFYKQNIIAGAIFFVWRDRALYKFGASDTKFERLNPNYLVFWHAIQWLCMQHYTELSFGRTDINNAGLIQFKDGWGAQRDHLDYYKYNYKSASFMPSSQDSSEKGYLILKKIPIPILRTMGSILYRHMG